MLLEFKLPDIGEGVHEGEIVTWHVKAGDKIEEDQPLLDVMTDKVTAEIPSPSAGTVKELKAQPGETVAVGAVIVTIETEAAEGQNEEAQPEQSPEKQESEKPEPEKPQDTPQDNTAPKTEDQSEKPQDDAPQPEKSEDDSEQPSEDKPAQNSDEKPEEKGSTQPKDQQSQEQPSESQSSENQQQEVLAAPATRKLAQELGLDLSKISGTGVKGRITAEDVLKAGDVQEPVPGAESEPQKTDEPSKNSQDKQEAPKTEQKPEEPPKDKNHSASTPTIEVWFDKAPDKKDADKKEPEAGKGAPDNKKEDPKKEAAPSPPDAQNKPQDNKPADDQSAQDKPKDSQSQQSSEKPDPNRRVPFVGIRKKIAEHLSLSKQKAPHFGYVEEADLTELVALRAQFKQAAHEQGATLTYLPFVIKAVIEGLKAFPILNTTLDEDKHELVYQADFNIGLAIATDNGLVVPVIKQPDKLSILQLAQKIAELAEKARNNKLSLEEMRGGTFTITSIGSIGGLFGIPIINYPEVGILCFNKIQKRPVVKPVDGEDQIVIRSMSYLSMTCDHRVVDGAEAAKFMAKIIQVLEHPTQLLLG